MKKINKGTWVRTEREIKRATHKAFDQIQALRISKSRKDDIMKAMDWIPRLCGLIALKLK